MWRGALALTHLGALGPSGVREMDDDEEFDA